MQNTIKTAIIIAWLVLITALVTVSLKVSYNNDKWLKDNHEDEIKLNILEKNFQNYEQFVISYNLATSNHNTVFSSYNINQIDNLYKQLKKIKYVSNILTPLTANVLLEDPTNNSLENITYKKAIDKGYFKNEAEINNSFKQSFYYKRIVSADFTKITIVLDLKTLNDDKKRNLVVQQIKNITNNFNTLPPPKYSGNALLNFELNQKTKTNLAKLVLVAFAVMFVVSYLIGGYKKAFLILGVVVITVLTAIATIYFNGHRLSSLSVALVIMVSVVGASDALHISEYFQRISQNTQKNQAIIQTFKHTFLPCLLTSLTTAIGFGTFMISSLIPLFEFGMDATIAICLSFIINMLFINSFFYVFNFNIANTKFINKYYSVSNMFINFITRLSIKNTTKVVASFAIISLILLAVLPFSKTESNFLDVFFKKNSTFYKNFTYVDQHFYGSGNFNIILTSTENDFFKKVSSLNMVKNITTDLQKIPYINVTNSYLLSVNMVHNKFKPNGLQYPTTNDLLAQELLFLEFSRTDETKGILSNYVNFNYTTANIVAKTNNLSSTTIKQLLNSINGVLANYNVNAFVTGTNQYFYSLSNSVLQTQFLTIALCAVIIFALFVVFFRLRLAIKSVIVALFPIVFVLATIVLAQVPFDFAIVLVSSVALGISVDNTLHILNNYISLKKQYRNTLHYAEIVKQALEIPSSAIVQSTIVFTLVSAVFLFADLVLLNKFGIFLSIALLSGLVSSTLLFVALLNYGNNKKNIKLC